MNPRYLENITHAEWSTGRLLLLLLLEDFTTIVGTQITIVVWVHSYMTLSKACCCANINFYYHLQIYIYINIFILYWHTDTNTWRKSTKWTKWTSSLQVCSFFLSLNMKTSAAFYLNWFILLLLFIFLKTLSFCKNIYQCIMNVSVSAWVFQPGYCLVLHWKAHWNSSKIIRW